MRISALSFCYNRRMDNILRALLVSVLLTVAPAAHSKAIRVDIDPSLLPSGILYDRVLPISHLDRMDGSRHAEAVTPARWRQALHELSRASMVERSWPTADGVRARARELSPFAPIPVGVIDVSYEQLQPDARERGLVTVEGDIVRVVSEGAVFSSRAFAAAPIRHAGYRGGAMAFVFPRTLYVTNEATEPHLRVDFGDGEGFRPVGFDTPVPVYYATTGDHTIEVRATHDGDATLESRFTFRVAALAAPLPHDTIQVTASIPYQAVQGTGEAYVYLAPGHTSVTNPVVVVEGFDIDDTLNWDELYELLNDENLLEDLRTAGYDAVVLNFTDGTAPIQRNAFMLVELLQQIQSMIAPQAKYALVGASMGGLVSRYALAYMEDTAIPHRVATFVSFDTPHNGANIPLGLQWWLDFFGPESDAAAFLLSRLDTPAARQMLVYHHAFSPSSTPGADALRASFESDLAAVGDFPAQPRLVAVANGSGNSAGQGFNAGDQIIQYEYNIGLANVIGNCWAVPDGTGGTIFDGLYFILFVQNRSLTVTLTTGAPYDNAPGGSRNSMAQMDSTEAPVGDIIALHDDHCFIPTISALDVNTTNLFYNAAADPNLVSNTPFDAVYVPLANQPHVDVTPENKTWLLSEILGTSTAAPKPSAPATVRLWQNTPNPFNPSTSIAFSIPERGHVRLEVFDVRGARVTVLADGVFGPGAHRIQWDGRARDGARLASGVFFYRLTSAGTVLSRRMLLLK